MVKLVNGKRGNWGTYSIFKLFKNVKKIRNAYTGCQELFMRGFLVTVKSLLTREKSFFFSRRFACRDVGLRPSPNHPATGEKKISGTQGKQAVQLAETGQGRLALTTNKRFEISAFISFHVEQFISSNSIFVCEAYSCFFVLFCFFIQ